MRGWGWAVVLLGPGGGLNWGLGFWWWWRGVLDGGFGTADTSVVVVLPVANVRAAGEGGCGGCAGLGLAWEG